MTSGFRGPRRHVSTGSRYGPPAWILIKTCLIKSHFQTIRIFLLWTKLLHASEKLYLILLYVLVTLGYWFSNSTFLERCIKELRVPLKYSAKKRKRKKGIVKQICQKLDDDECEGWVYYTFLSTFEYILKISFKEVFKLLKGMLHQNESELSSLVRSGPWRREEIHHQRGVCGWGLWGEGEPGCLVPWVTQLLDIWDKLPKDGGCLEFPTPPPTLHPLMLTGCWTGFGCSPQAGRKTWEVWKAKVMGSRGDSGEGTNMDTPFFQAVFFPALSSFSS